MTIFGLVFDWILWTAFCFSDEKPAWLPQVWLKLFLLKCNWNLSRVWVWVWVAPNPLPGSFHRFKIDRSKIVHVDSQIKDSSNSGLYYGYARICRKYQRGRVENDVSNRALPLPGHFDSQIKDSSNSFRRRHSSEGVDAKFSSTLPKDSAVSDSLDKNKYLDTAEIWSY